MLEPGKRKLFTEGVKRTDTNSMTDRNREVGPGCWSLARERVLITELRHLKSGAFSVTDEIRQDIEDALTHMKPW